MKKLYFFLVALFISCIANAQMPTFSKVYYDVAGVEQAYAVVASFDHNYLLAGERDQNGLVMKIDSAGNIIWCKKIGDDNNTVFRGIVSTNDSCYVLMGRCKNSTLYNADVICVKINSGGDTLWSKSIDLGGDEYATSIQQTNDHGFIISGVRFQSTSTPYTAMFLLKLNSAGNMTWVRTIISNNYQNQAFSVKQMPDSGYVLIGYTESEIGTTFDGRACLIRLNSAGHVLWSKMISRSNSWGCDLAITHDGILCYIAFNDGTGIVFSKTDFAGNVLWSKRNSLYTSVGNLTEPPPKLYPVYDGGYLYTGGEFPGGGYIVKIDSTGSPLWSKSLQLRPTDVVEKPDSGIMVIGNGPIGGIKTYPTYNPQIGIISTDSSGNSVSYCINDYFVSGDTILLNFLMIDSTMASGGVIEDRHPVVSGFTLDSYEGCVAFQGSIEENEAGNIVIYPNPANNSLTLENSTFIDNANISVYNIQGQLVLQQPVQTAKTTVDISGLSNGLYLIKLSSLEGIVAKKFIKE